MVENKGERFVRIVDRVKFRCFTRENEYVSIFSDCFECKECTQEEKRLLFERALSVSEDILIKNGLGFVAQRTDGTIVYYGSKEN